MRNLEATSYVALPPSPLLASASCFCLDSDAGCAWVVSSAGLCCVASDNQVTVEVPLVEGGHMTSDDHVIGAEHVSDLESVCLATRKGDILLYNTHNKDVECVGSVGVGLLHMAWSPDQELVVFCTGQDTLLLMTHQLDPPLEGGHEFVPVIETAMSPEGFGEVHLAFLVLPALLLFSLSSPALAKLVTLGWGQKATQFHGSLGKQSAKEAPPAEVGPALPWDDMQPRVSWRGDGEYFVCSSVDSKTGGRKLRVWTREGVLHSTAGETDKLEHALHWRPSGNLFASSQCLPHTHQIVFFERNGLQHGGFPLPPDQQSLQVRELQWNSDSTVLCLWLEGRSTKAAAPKDDTSALPSHSIVQLWCVGNYHWYLKQELRPPLSPGSAHPARLSAVHWDPLSPLKLHLLTTDGCYVCYNWNWSVAKSRSLSPDNLCDVAVIDGAHLLITPLRHTITPPPMSTHTLTLPTPILHVTHAPPPHTNDFLVVTSDGQIAVFTYCEGERGEGEGVRSEKEKKPSLPRPPRLVGMARLPVMPSPIRQLCWRQSDTVVGVAWDSSRLSDSVVEFSLTVDREEGRVEVGKCHTTPLPSPSSLLTLTSHPHTSTVIGQLKDGTILKYSSTNGLSPWQLPSGAELQFPDQSCDHVAIALFQNEEHVVGLNIFRHSLYINDCRVATGVTTFDLHNEFLLFTTDSHTCRFIPLNSDPSVQTLWTVDTPRPLDEGVRKVERGSKIVTVVPHDFKLVLQMPRGNLETICPRALVLSAVRRHLDQLQYREAFVVMRRHRINLNLIYDHDPETFLAHTKEFVEQLSSMTYVNLFLTELREEDTTVSMYPGLGSVAQKVREEPMEKKREEEKGEREVGTKVDTVCEAVRKALVELGENKYLLSVITSLVKKTMPELETVLLKIKHLRDNPPPISEALQHVTAEEALKYALFLVDVNQLYDVALGMYEFELVLMVAEKSQKDPKEYLPFLNELQKLPLHYQRYKIDRHLRRYQRALANISLCGPEKFDECLSLIKEQSLYAEALDIFCDRSSHECKTIARCYGEYLIDSGRHREAGIIFFQGGFLQEALQSYEKAGCWQQVFALSAQLSLSGGEQAQLARRMAVSLKTQRKHSAAATVLLDYAKDVEEAMVTLLEGSHWEEALRIAYLHSRPDLIETHLKPHLLEAHQHHISLLSSLTSSLTRHTARLQLVRENKRKKQEAILEGTYAADERDADLFSDTSSVTGRSVTASLSSTQTGTSRASGKSQKNRRKAEHKRWSLREGSSREDLALLEAITEICNTADNMQEDISSLMTVLMQYGHTSEAKQLQIQLSELLEKVKRSLPSVWPPQATPLLSNQLPTGPQATVNSILAAMSSAPQPHTLQPAVEEELFPRPKLRDVKWQLHLFS